MFAPAWRTPSLGGVGAGMQCCSGQRLRCLRGRGCRRRLHFRAAALSREPCRHLCRRRGSLQAPCARASIHRVSSRSILDALHPWGVGAVPWQAQRSACRGRRPSFFCCNVPGRMCVGMHAIGRDTALCHVYICCDVLGRRFVYLFCGQSRKSGLFRAGGASTLARMVRLCIQNHSPNMGNINWLFLKCFFSDGSLWYQRVMMSAAIALACRVMCTVGSRAVCASTAAWTPYTWTSMSCFSNSMSCMHPVLQWHAFAFPFLCSIHFYILI